MTDTKREVLTVGAQWGTVRALTDGGVSWTMRSTLEVSEETFLDMARLAKRGTAGYCLFVVDEADAQNVVIPEMPALPAGSKRKQTKSQELRFGYEILAGEYGEVDTEAFYNDRMDKHKRDVWNEIEDVRRAKHYEEQFNGSE